MTQPYDWSDAWQRVGFLTQALQLLAAGDTGITPSEWLKVYEAAFPPPMQ